MKILLAPNEVLSAKAKPIKHITKEIKRIIDDMKDTLVKASDPEGVGLAAPQVGESLQLFIMKPTAKSSITVCINPQVTVHEVSEKQEKKRHKHEEVQLEGCLSLKDIWGTVQRAQYVLMQYIDEDGKKHSKEVKGFEAIIVQHEFDHLQGILFPRRVLEQKGKLYKSHKNSKGDDEFEEMEI